MNIVAIIESKNPDEVTQRELNRLKLVIEEAERELDGLQRLHRSLTGQNHIPPIRL